MKRPRFFGNAGNGVLDCRLCPRNCTLPPGAAGRCGVRRNRDGEGDIPRYGQLTALGRDPIEKKPLYHFRPGTEILSAGFSGCNLFCPFCQNWHISQNVNTAGRFCSPAGLATAAKEPGALAFTYSEPLVHVEFVLDCMEETAAAGIANVLVSNGCVNKEAAREILERADAANIDLKSFSAKTYREVLGGDLKTVTTFIETAAEMGVHLEITTLIVPGLNDSRDELDKCRDFIAGIERAGKKIPWHLSAYHPAYKYRAPPTEAAFLISAARRAAEKLEFVYIGNIPDAEGAERFRDTRCPCCGQILVSRRHYPADNSGLLLRERDGNPEYRCASCGGKVPIRYRR